MTTMRHFLNIITESQRLDEQSRAPLYHATGLTGALGILTSGHIIPDENTGGWRGYEGKRIIPVTRDERYRFSGGGHHDENGNIAIETGHGPVQFVLDAEIIRQRFKVEPFDMAQMRFNATAQSDPEWEEEDPYGNWKYSHNIRRKESEERIEIPKGRDFKLDDVCKAVILEPISQDWLRLHHGEKDRTHLTGSGEEREFEYAQKKLRHDDGARPTTKFWGNDFTGVDSKVYARIIMLAKRRGIPVIDRRNKAG